MGRQPQTSGSLALEQKNVIVIEAAPRQEPEKLRVAAYCRVSSDSTDQLNSFMAQLNYYTTLIGSKENWTLADLYADDSDIFEPSQKVLAKPSVFLVWSNFLSFWANIYGGVAWDIFFLPAILREASEKQLQY